MQLGQMVLVRTNATTDLTAAAAQNAIITVDIANAAVGAGGTARCRMKSLALISDQQLAWEVNFFGTADYATLVGTSLEDVHWFGRFAFQAGDGTQIAGAGPFYYYVDGLDIAYQDFDINNKVRNPVAAPGKIHLGIVNRSAVAKIAGATGRLSVRIGVEPTLTGA